MGTDGVSRNAHGQAHEKEPITACKKTSLLLSALVTAFAIYSYLDKELKIDNSASACKYLSEQAGSDKSEQAKNILAALESASLFFKNLGIDPVAVHVTPTGLSFELDSLGGDTWGNTEIDNFMDDLADRHEIQIDVRGLFDPLDPSSGGFAVFNPHSVFSEFGRNTGLCPKNTWRPVTLNPGTGHSDSSSLLKIDYVP